MPVIALDLGGTKLAAALISDEGNIIIAETQPLEKRAGPDVADLILLRANQMLTTAIEKNMRVTSLGICVPGISYSKTKKVWAPNIPGWIDYPLFDELQNCLADKNLKIKIDSDGAFYILGELWKEMQEDAGMQFFFLLEPALAQVSSLTTKFCGEHMTLGEPSDG